MNEKLKFFFAGVSFTVIVRSLWVRVQGFFLLRKILKEMVCPKCRGKKEISFLVPGTTSMETYPVTCDVCKGSGHKELPVPADVFFK